MLDTPLSKTLNDLLEGFAERSDRIGKSCAGVSAYGAENWEKSFCRHYHVRRFRLVPAEETFSESLSDWLGNVGPEAAEAITDLLGEPIAVLRAADEKKLLDRLSSCNGRIGAYYFTEDVFFVAFQTHVLAFLMGNFE